MRRLFGVAFVLFAAILAGTPARAQTADWCERTGEETPLALNTIRPIKVPMPPASARGGQFVRYSLDLRNQSGAVIDLVQAPSAATGQLEPVLFPMTRFCKEQDGRWQTIGVRATSRVSSVQESPGGLISRSESALQRTSQSRGSEAGAGVEASLRRPTQLRQWRVRGGARIALLINRSFGSGEFELFARPRTFPKIDEIASGMTHPGEIRKGQTKLLAFDGKKDQRILIEVSSEADDFDSFVALYGPGDETSSRIGEDDDGGTGGNARLVADLPREGKYVMEIASLSEGGKFNVKYQTLNCPVGDPPKIELGTEMLGSFGRSEDFCYVAETGELQGNPYHLYSFKGMSEHRYSVTMRGVGSEETRSDTALMVRVAALVISEDDETRVVDRDPAGRHALVAENDDYFFDSAETDTFFTDSRIVVRYVSGDSTMFVQAVLGEPTGDYTIRIEDCEVAPVTCGTTESQ